MENLFITSDKEKLDLKFITGFISQSYWAKERTLEMMQKCIDNSLNFGIFLDGKQVGYARVVTDYVQFAYLMDVFIDKVNQGKGYSGILMEHILQTESLKGVKVWRLATSDAHGLYRKFGFTELKKPENMMELIR
ncbi:hypothetical protein D3C87_64870 [compost metagenome]